MTTQSSLEAYTRKLTSAVEIIGCSGKVNDSNRSSQEGISLDVHQNVREARQSVLESTMKIQQMVVGPSGYLPYLALHVSCAYSYRLRKMHSFFLI